MVQDFLGWFRIKTLGGLLWNQEGSESRDIAPAPLEVNFTLCTWFQFRVSGSGIRISFLGGWRADSQPGVFGRQKAFSSLLGAATLLACRARTCVEVERVGIFLPARGK